MKKEIPKRTAKIYPFVSLDIEGSCWFLMKFNSTSGVKSVVAVIGNGNDDDEHTAVVTLSLTFIDSAWVFSIAETLVVSSLLISVSIVNWSATVLDVNFSLDNVDGADIVLLLSVWIKVFKAFKTFTVSSWSLSSPLSSIFSPIVTVTLVDDNDVVVVLICGADSSAILWTTLLLMPMSDCWFKIQINWLNIVHYKRKNNNYWS